MTLTHPSTTDQFLQQIIEDSHEGREFIPLIGSGFSSPSGILMGQDFNHYLAYAAFRVLADPGAVNERRWNLNADGWPPYPASEGIADARNWLAACFKEVCKRIGLEIDCDDEGKIKSLVHTSTGVASDLAAATCRPLIPAVLRSYLAAPEEEVSRQLMARFGSTDSASLLVPPESSASSEDFIIEQGIRALFDWRATLEFLATVRVVNGALTSCPRNPAIIDDFNRHITRNRQPNLGHKMLAHLAEPMRMRIVLTTNFDELIEKAFERFSQELSMVPVGKSGSLPDPRIVHAQNCIVKLHGDLSDTRADFSLDDEPTSDDKATFAAYFRIPSIHQLHDENSSSVAHHLPRRLLVVGYSGCDARCVKLVKYLLDADIQRAQHSGNPRRMAVYWICFNDADVLRVQRLFAEKVYADRIVLHQTSRPDLLLYQLYQKLVLCLPPGGLTYEFTHEVPPFRSPEFDSTTQDRQAVVNHVRQGATLLNAARAVSGSLEHIKRLARDALVEVAGNAVVDFFEHGRLEESAFKDYISIFPIDEPLRRAIDFKVATDAVRSLRIPFMKFKQCLWFELQDFTDADALFKVVIRTLALRVGRFQLQHVSLFPSSDSLHAIVQLRKKKQDTAKEVLAYRLREQFREFRIEPQSWTLFFYGRDVPGSTSGWLSTPWKAATYKALRLLIEILSGLGFRIIHVPLTKSRSERKRRVTDNLLRSPINLADHLKRTADSWLPTAKSEKGSTISDEQMQRTASYEDYANEMNKTTELDFPPSADSQRDITLEESATPLSVFESIIEAVKDKFLTLRSGTEEDRRTLYVRLTFLYSLTLFRHSRHASALFSEATYQCPFRFNASSIDNDWLRANETSAWIRTLRECRVLLEKPGGHLWMHRDVRLNLQKWLDAIRLDEHPLFKEARPYTFLGQFRARAHFWIGDWYFKAFAASSHLTPITESLFHRFQCARFCRWSAPRAAELKGDNESNVRTYRWLLFRSALMEIQKLLQISRPSLKFWLANPLKGSMWSNLTMEPGGKEKKLTEIVTEWIPPDIEQSQKDGLVDLIGEVVSSMEDVGRTIMSEGGAPHTRVYRSAGSHAVQHDGPAPKKIALEHDLSGLLVSDNEFSARYREQFGRIGAITLVQAMEKPLNSTTAIYAFLRDLGETKANLLTGEHGSNAEFTRATIWLLSECAYSMARRAKLKYHAAKRIDRRLWQQVCAYCNVGIDFCKHLPAFLWRDELYAKIKLQGIYSLGLANLGRFFEAHRHLNEAHAMLTKLQTQNLDEEFAILCLRRAELHLTEAFWIQEKVWRNVHAICDAVDDPQALELARKGFVDTSETPNLNWVFVDVGNVANNLLWQSDNVSEVCKDDVVVVPARISECLRKSKTWLDFKMRIDTLHAAALDDAWNELDRAEKCMAGRTHSALWWGRLCTLRLRVYGGLRDKSRENGLQLMFPLMFRSGHGYSEILMWYRRGMRVVDVDPYRCVRMIEYFVDATKCYCIGISNTEASKCKSEMQEAVKRPLKIAEGEIKGLPGEDAKGPQLLTMYLMTVKGKVSGMLP